jgi:hypothetical protein
MKKFLSGLCASALTVAVGLTGVMPANAAPVYVPSAVKAQQSDVIQVQDGMRWKKRRGGWSSGPSFGNDRINRNIRRSNNWDGNWRRSGSRYGWYNGHRGYRYKRRGYRYHDGFWFPAGAFIAGAVIGGAIANSNNAYAGGSAHVQWCYDRYRSYRAYDNTFQPYNGPRRQCYSPYS